MDQPTQELQLATAESPGSGDDTSPARWPRFGCGFSTHAWYGRNQFSSSTKGTAMTVAPTHPARPTHAARIRELLLLNLFVVFSERDPDRRLKAIVANYTEDVVWSDSEATTHGHEELNERAQLVLNSTPDFVFNAAGPVHALRDGPAGLQLRSACAAARGHRLRLGARRRWTERRAVHADQRAYRPDVGELIGDEPA
jgi:hypothetical protein